MSGFASEFAARLVKDQVRPPSFSSPQHSANHATQVAYLGDSFRQNNNEYLAVGAKRMEFDHRDLLDTEIYISSDAGSEIWAVDADRREDDGYFSYHTHTFVIPGRGDIERFSEYRIQFDSILQVYRVSMWKELRIPRRERYDEFSDPSDHQQSSRFRDVVHPVFDAKQLVLPPAESFNWADEVEEDQGLVFPIATQSITIDVAVAQAEAVANVRDQTGNDDLDSARDGSTVTDLELNKEYSPVRKAAWAPPGPSKLKFYSNGDNIDGTQDPVGVSALTASSPSAGAIIGDKAEVMASNGYCHGVAVNIDEEEYVSGQDEKEADVNLEAKGSVSGAEDGETIMTGQVDEIAGAYNPTIVEVSAPQDSGDASQTSSSESEEEEQPGRSKGRVVSGSSGATTVESTTPPPVDLLEDTMAEDLGTKKSEVVDSPKFARSRMSTPLPGSDTATALERFSLRMSGSRALVLHRESALKSGLEACLLAFKSLVFYRGLVAQGHFERLMTRSAYECLMSGDLGFALQILDSEMYERESSTARSAAQRFESGMAGSRAMVVYTPRPKQQEDSPIDLNVVSPETDLQGAREDESEDGPNLTLIAFFFGFLFLCAVFRS